MYRTFFLQTRLAWLVALIFNLGIGSVLRAEVVAFTVDPSRSTVTLSGDASGANLEAQGPGSLTTSFEGTMMVDLGTNEIRFPGGTRIAAQELNSWEPGPNGTAGSAPASYGGKATIGSGFLLTTAVAATRRISFDMLSLPLSLQDDSFNAEGLQFQFVEINNPTLDYRTTGFLNLRDNLTLSGLATNKVAGTSTLVTAGDIQTLTLQVNATYVFELFLPNDSSLSLTGQLVATRSSSGIPPTIVIAPVAPGANSMTLTWPAGYKLQKSIGLLSQSWADTSLTSPATIPFALGEEYFQVVPQ